MKRRTQWVTGLVLLIGAVLLGSAFWSKRPSPGLTAAVPPAPHADAASASSVRSMVGMGALAQPVTVPASAAASSASELDKARRTRERALIEQQWCTHAKQAHQQATDAIDQGRAGAGEDRAARESRSQAVVSLPTTQAYFEVRRRVLSDWARQLQGQGDLRSRATGLYLALKVPYPLDEKRDMEQQLQGLALGGSDPYVLSLWKVASLRCELGNVCTRPSRERWAQIEPGNLLAWLPDFADRAIPLTEAQWRGVAAARYVQSHAFELKARLLPLLAGEPGLAQDVGLAIIESEPEGATLGPSPMRLLALCAEAPVGAQRRPACVHAAELVWSMKQALPQEKIFALNNVGRLGASDTGQWGSRSAALKKLSEAQLEVLLFAEYPKFKSMPGCEQLPKRRQYLQDLTERGVWGIANAQLGGVLP